MVAIRSALILGRSVDNWVRRMLALPVFPPGPAITACKSSISTTRFGCSTRQSWTVESTAARSISPLPDR